MNFDMFWIAHGAQPFQTEAAVIDPSNGQAALDNMKQLYSLIDKKFFPANPIAVAEYMTTTDDYWYCPFAYGYSNYSREGYARHKLTYADLVHFDDRRLRSTIGGTGLAISATSKHKSEAIDFAQWICNPTTQSTFYTEHGGQPGHTTAWLSERTNRLTHNYFYTVLPAMQRGYLRPRSLGNSFF